MMLWTIVRALAGRTIRIFVRMAGEVWTMEADRIPVPAERCCPFANS